jgi:hypothetical protein
MSGKSATNSRLDAISRRIVAIGNRAWSLASESTRARRRCPWASDHRIRIAHQVVLAAPRGATQASRCRPGLAQLAAAWAMAMWCSASDVRSPVSGDRSRCGK